ncbi:MAG: hypothetical protein JWM41_4719 [Gemmatimonadetes bacterium]|nr:hypothetical protein [Gemmatimonadota bacterium]
MIASQPAKKIPKTRSAFKNAPTGSVGKEPAPVHDRSAIESEIRAQAYAIYLARGCTAGDDLLDWLEAERIVLYRRGIGG